MPMTGDGLRVSIMIEPPQLHTDDGKSWTVHASWCVRVSGGSDVALRAELAGVCTSDSVADANRQADLAVKEAEGRLCSAVRAALADAWHAA